MLVAYFFALCAFVLFAAAAPVMEKKALKQLIVKRADTPTATAGAEVHKPSK